MTIVRLPEKRKYRNRPGSEDGLRFDSQRELARYRELKILQAAGVIDKLKADKKDLRFPLRVAGQFVCTYVADFDYREKLGAVNWGHVVEDVKGCKTREYKIKKRLMKILYGIEIREV